MSVEQKIELLKTGNDIWKELIAQDKIQPHSYDKELVLELNALIFPNGSSDISKNLSETTISPNKFIESFFAVVQPYSLMMSDVLKMFEQAGAQQGEKNLAISFDFNNASPNFEFDLESFRSWLSYLTRAKTNFDILDIDTITGWSLVEALRVNDEKFKFSQEYFPELNNWIEEYRERDRLDAPFPPCPETHIEEFDVLIRYLWNTWVTMIEESLQYGKEMDSLRNINRQEANQTQRIQSIWPFGVIYQLHTDFWAADFILELYRLVEFLNQLTHEGPHTESNTWINKISDLTSEIGKVNVTREGLVKIMLDFLNMPMWDKRPELYSIWVGSQILDALRDYPVKIHTVNNTLIISQTGTHLATLDDPNLRLHIWAELLTKLENPVGNERKEAIKPDFSIMLEPVTSPESSVFEVEVKQWHKSSTRKFSEALTDYANGRSNSEVVLLNYGTAPSRILNSVEENVRGRTSIYEKVRPQSSSIDAFKLQLQELIAEKLYDSSVFPLTLKGLDMVDFRLSWEKDYDLDLYVTYSGVKPDFTVYYDNDGSLSSFPFVKLDEDIRNGNEGVEVIEIAQLMEGEYKISVHDYSNLKAFESDFQKVELNIGSFKKEVICENGEGRWWDIGILNTKEKKFYLVNKVRDEVERQARTIFEDNFEDNQNKWSVTETIYKLENSCYSIEHTRLAGSWLNWKLVKIPQEYDFEIEMVISKIFGIENSTYGILWGLADVNNYFEFAIKDDMEYSVRQMEEGSATQLVPWTPLKNTLSLSAKHEFEIKKKGEKLQFVVNRSLLCEIFFQAFYDNNIGFRLEKKIAINIHGIRINTIGG